MSAASDYLKNANLNHLFRNIALASPASTFVSLHQASPEDADFSAIGKPVPGQTGIAASIVAGAPAGQMRLSGLTGMIADSVLNELEVSGAASGGNNGTFPIATFISADVVDVVNGAAVIPDANNPAIVWTEREEPTEILAAIGYARQELFPADWDAPVNGIIQNSSVITWGPATADWGQVTHFGIHDALVAGNLITHGKTAGLIVLNTESYQTAIAGLSVRQK